METKEVQRIYDQVYKATEQAQKAGVALAEAKSHLAKEILKATANGSIVGKNEKERNAVSYQRFEGEYNNQQQLENAYAEEVNALTLAKITLQCLRDRIRVEELAEPIEHAIS